MTTSFKGLLVGLVALPVLLSFQNCSGVQFSGAGARLVAKGDTTGTDPAINFVDSSGAPVIDLGDGGSSVPMNVPPTDSGTSGGTSGSSGDSNDVADNGGEDVGDSTDGADSSDTTQDGSTSNSGDTAGNSSDPDDSTPQDSGDNPDVVENPVSTPEDQEPTRPGKNPDVVKNENRPEHPVQNENPDGGDGMFYVCVLEGPGRSQLLHFEDIGFNSRVSMPQAVCTTKFACESLVSQKFSVKLAHKRGACGRNPHMVNLSELEIMSLLGL